MTRFGQSLLLSSSVKKKTKGGSARRVEGQIPVEPWNLLGCVIYHTCIGTMKILQYTQQHRFRIKERQLEQYFSMLIDTLLFNFLVSSLLRLCKIMISKYMCVTIP